MSEAEKATGATVPAATARRLWDRLSAVAAFLRSLARGRSNAAPMDPAAAGETTSGDDGTERQFVRLLWGFARPFRARLVLLLALTIIRATCLAFIVYFLNQALGSLFTAGEVRTASFFWAVGGLLLCQLLAALSQFYGDETQRRFLESMEVATLQWVLQHMVLLPAGYFRTKSLGKLVFQLEKVQGIVRTYAGSLLSMAIRGCTILGILAGILPQAPLFAGLGVAFLVVTAVLAYRRAYHIRYLTRDAEDTDVGLIERLLTIFSNLRDVHNFGLHKQALQQFDDSCKVLVARVAQKARAQGGISLWINGAGILVLAATALIVMGGGTGQVGALTCFAAMGMLLDPLSDLVRTRIILQGRLFKIGELFEIVERLKAHPQTQPCRQPLLDEPLECVFLKRVGYTVNGVSLLQDITFRVFPGEVLGIIGRSGAGKTTLANLILRLLEPTTGHILVNGVEARRTDLAGYWRQSGYVAQVPCRLNATIREEVALAQPGASDAEIDRALTAAGIDPALGDRNLERLAGPSDNGPALWHTRSLQQRVEWARLYVRSPRLLVLDEPTSLADAAEEQRYIQDLRERRHERLTVVISHRPATLAACDRLLVLEGGRIVDRGYRREVLPRWWPRLDGAEEQAR